jgi:hypothetical protein
MRRTVRVLLTTALAAGLGLLTVGPAAAAPAGTVGAAATAPEYGFVFADQPTTPSYTPNPRMSANSKGFTNTVTRHGTGRYTVRMPLLGLFVGGNVQVTAYGEHSNRCKSDTFEVNGGDAHVGVRCTTPGGNLVDSQFVAQYYRAGSANPHQSAYLFADRPGTSSYTADPDHSYNSKGGSNGITRTSVGVYRVTFGGFSQLGGLVHVTAAGFNGNHCNVRGWGASSADVRCYTPAGQLVDEKWWLRYHDRHVANDGVEHGGYVWADDFDAPLGTSYQPNALHSFNSQGETNRVRRVATGRYEVTLTRVPAFDAGSPMATAHHTPGVACKVTELFSSGSGSRVDVDCRNSSGVLVNARFTVSQTTNR